EIGDAVRAAKHLVDDVHVKLLIGPSTSKAQVQVFRQVVLPHKDDATNNVVMLTRTAFDNVLSDPQNAGLAWSVSPSSSTRAFAVDALFQEQESQIRARM